MKRQDPWSSGEAYERYMGRWSPHLAELFVDWLAVPSGKDLPAGKDWLDVGCGTGALSRIILDRVNPAKVIGVDPSEAFVATARERVQDARVDFRIGSAQSLPVDDASFDAVASGLMLNFVPDAAAALQEMKRCARGGGVIGAYVWDYADGMTMLRTFFDTAIALDPAVAELDEGVRFSLCHPDALERIFREAGLREVETRALEFTMVFADFDDYWQPFLGGVGPAPSYVVSLPEEKRGALREALRARLPASADGSIRLGARAWAVKGVNK